MNITDKSYFVFSGGEVHCKLDKQDAQIIMRDYTMNGFMTLAEHVEVMRRNGTVKISVSYPYLPYARQDRVMESTEPFSLKVFCDLLNSLKLYSVWLCDPHSDVAPALIDNCYIKPQWQIARSVIPDSWFVDPDAIFVSPDAGAYKKVAKLFHDDSRIAIGTKMRDASGKIIHTDVFCPTSVRGMNCMIVDDICDGGRTFIALAKALKEQGAKTICLYVTHGIFSQGLNPLIDAGIDQIFTTNTFDQSRYVGTQGLGKLTVREII